jgi:hypothetical protein
METSDVLRISVGTILCPSLLFFSNLADASKKPWDKVRYAACTNVLPYDELDRFVTVTSAKCRQQSQTVDQKQFGGSDLVADPLFASIRRTDRSSDWLHSLMIRITYARVKNFLAEDNRGAARFDEVVFVLDGAQVAKKFDGNEDKFVGCETYRAFETSSTSCKYEESLALVFSADESTKLLSKLSADPQARLKMRIEGKAGEAFDLEFDVAEFAAVLDASATVP